MTNPTPPTPTGDSVTSPAGSVRAVHTALPWSLSTYSNYHGFGIMGRDGFGCIAERWEDAPSLARQESIRANGELIVASVNRFPAIIAAVEKALAAWDEMNVEDRPLRMAISMRQLRAIHSETKGNTK